MGFATLPNQVHRKSVKKGFDFTLMVAGETAHGWRWLGHIVGGWRGPALLTSLKSDSSLRRNGPSLTTRSPLEPAPSVASPPTGQLVCMVKAGPARDPGKERGRRVEELGDHIYVRIETSYSKSPPTAGKM